MSSAGIDMAGKPITNLQSGGITSTDSSAVSGSAVYDYLQSNYATSANTGYTVNVRDGSSTSTFRVANNGAISYVAGDNVELSGENGSVTIGMSLTPVFTSATFGTAGSGTTIGSTGVTLSNGAFFTTAGINAGGSTITNAGTGALAANSTDVVTGVRSTPRSRRSRIRFPRTPGRPLKPRSRTSRWRMDRSRSCRRRPMSSETRRRRVPNRSATRSAKTWRSRLRTTPSRSAPRARCRSTR